MFLLNVGKLQEENLRYLVVSKQEFVTPELFYCLFPRVFSSS